MMFSYSTVLPSGNNLMKYSLVVEPVFVFAVFSNGEREDEDEEVSIVGGAGGGALHWCDSGSSRHETATSSFNSVTVSTDGTTAAGAADSIPSPSSSSSLK